MSTKAATTDATPADVEELEERVDQLIADRRSLPNARRQALLDGDQGAFFEAERRMLTIDGEILDAQRQLLTVQLAEAEERIPHLESKRAKLREDRDAALEAVQQKAHYSNYPAPRASEVEWAEYRLEVARLGEERAQLEIQVSDAESAYSGALREVDDLRERLAALDKPQPPKSPTDAETPPPVPSLMLGETLSWGQRGADINDYRSRAIHESTEVENLGPPKGDK